jgi:hypothetical protein
MGEVMKSKCVSCKNDCASKLVVYSCTLYEKKHETIKQVSENMIIYIVRKHPIIRRGYFGSWAMKAFEIFSTHATRKEAAAVVKEKNAKAKDFKYMVGKVELKAKDE